MQWASKGCLITQFDHIDVEAIGLPKIDLLGIRALTVLADAVTAVRRENPDFKLDDIPADDPVTGEMLAHGNTIGVFQCESEGARRTLLKLRAKSVRDLAVANAFFKPGPATGGMADAFVQRYRGQAASHLPAPIPGSHPGKNPGDIVVPGANFARRHRNRRVKLAASRLSTPRDEQNAAAEMTQMQEQFITGCQRPAPQGPGLSPRQAQQLWEQVSAFSGYGFNQGHATAYANISYRSAYLKAHWPEAFFYGRLQSWGGFHHPAIYMAEAMRLGIDVRLPHVNHSTRKFSLTWEGEQPVLWMGLGQVRDVRDSILRATDSSP